MSEPVNIWRMVDGPSKIVVWADAQRKRQVEIIGIDVEAVAYRALPVEEFDAIMRVASAWLDRDEQSLEYHEIEAARNALEPKP